MSVLPRIAGCSWSFLASASNRASSSLIAARSFSLYFNNAPLPTGGCNALAQASGCSRTSLLSPSTIPGPSSTATVPALLQVRHKPRDYFPFPKEWKRIKKGGFDEKRATVDGRLIILRKMIKGKSVLGH